jgi:hypothetical protein
MLKNENGRPNLIANCGREQAGEQDIAKYRTLGRLVLSGSV